MFDVSIGICNTLKQTQSNNQNRAAFQQVVRLLHVYIFPNIAFGQAERDIITDALVTINKDASDIEKLIKLKTTSRQNTRQSLSAQRQDFINSGMFWGPKKLSKLDRDFLKLVLRHVAEDLESEREKINTFEDNIGPLRNSTDAEQMDKLKLLRHNRNFAHAHFEQLLRVREEITDFFGSRRHASTKINQPLQFPIYTKMSERVHTFEASIKDFFNRKVKVARVREATCFTVREIDKFGKSFGYFRCDDLTNVAANQPKEWGTIVEKVHSMLECPKIPYGTKFRIFCAKTKENCVSVLSRMDEDIRAHEKQELCRELCSKVLNHMVEMSETLSRNLDGFQCGSKLALHVDGNVFACYEPYVSKELLKDLGSAFKACYREQCTELVQWMSRNKEICCRKWTMADAQGPEIMSNVCLRIVNELNTANSIAGKLRLVKAISKYAEKLLKERQLSDPCADDLVDMIIELCSKLDQNTLLKLFSMVKLLEGLCPDFWSGTSHNYAVVTVSAAHNFLVEQMRIAESHC